jgi:hypothetical protein
MQFQRLLAEAGVCVWLAAGFLTMSAEPRQLRTGVVAMDYRGWPESLVVEATDVEVKLVVAPAVGGRIVEYSLDGQNILSGRHRALTG